MTPNHRPPLLARMMLPRAAGLESNPLYLRLSGKAYPKRRRWPRLRQAIEFQGGRQSSWGGLLTPLILSIGGIEASRQIALRTGLETGWQFLLFVACAFLALGGGFLLALYVFHGGKDPVIERFLRNASTEPWGAAISLTSLGGWEIDAAVLGALIGRSIGDSIALMLKLIAIPLLMWAGGSLLDGEFPPPLASGMTWLILGVFFPPLAAQIWAMSVVDIALGADAARQWAISANLGPENETARASSVLPLALQLPGIAGLFGFAVLSQYPPLADVIDAWPDWVIMAAGVYVFALPNAGFGYFAAKSWIAAGWGNIGDAMEIMIRGENLSDTEARPSA